jgi:hypothetical protein
MTALTAGTALGRTCGAPAPRPDRGHRQRARALLLLADTAGGHPLGSAADPPDQGRLVTGRGESAHQAPPSRASALPGVHR